MRDAVAKLVAPRLAAELVDAARVGRELHAADRGAHRDPSASSTTWSTAARARRSSPMCCRSRTGGPHDPNRRRPSSYLAPERPALACRPDAAAHLRPLRADPPRLSDRANISPISPAPASSNRSMCRPTGRRSASRTRRRGCSGRPTRTGWPHAIVAYADFAVDDVRPQLDRLARYPLVRGVRMQLHWHENPLYRFAARADLCADPTIRRNVARLADYGWSFDLQVFAPQMAGAADLAEACPDVTFVLQHAGMLEDLSPARARRSGAPAWCGSPPARMSSPSSRASAPSCIATTPRHIADVVARDGRDVRRRALPVRLELSDREALDELRASSSAPIDAAAASSRAERAATRSCATRRCASIASPP